MKERTWHRLAEMNPFRNKLTEGDLDALYEYTTMAVEFYETGNLRSLETMSVKTTTLFLPEGKVLSSDVATILVKEYSSGYGYAVASQEEPGVDVAKGLGAVKADKLVALTEANKDNKLVLWMVHSDTPLQESDLQPFSFIDDELVGCLQGDFSGWAQDGSSTPHTNEYHACEKRIKPKLIKLWKENSSSRDVFEKAMKNADTDDTNDSMAELCPDNASIVYLTAAGLCFPVSKPDDREIERPWGYEYAGQTQAVAEPPAPTGKKKAVLSLADDEPASPPKNDKPSAEKSEFFGSYVDMKTKVVKHGGKDFPFELALKQDGVTPIDIDGSGVYTVPPADCTTKEQLEKFYKEKLGYRPSNWKRRPGIKVLNPSSVKSLGELSNSAAAAALQTAAGAKDTRNKFVPAPKVMQTTVAKNFISVEYPKIVGNNSEFIQNPDAIFKNEEKDPSAAAMMNDQRFVGIKDFDMPHSGRCFILSHIGGPASESYIALASAIWRDNMLARISAERKNVELLKRIETLEKERDEALTLAIEAKPPIEAPKKKVSYALK